MLVKYIQIFDEYFQLLDNNTFFLFTRSPKPSYRNEEQEKVIFRKRNSHPPYCIDIAVQSYLSNGP